MISAFCPGHITCFFHPVRTDALLTTGSRGVGIKIDLGAEVVMEERSDDRIITVMDGEECECGITNLAIKGVSDRGYDVTITNGLPVGQGFGMSAAGAIASAMCACAFEDKPMQKAYESAHSAEIIGGGGLGDVSGILGASEVPVRAVAGLPPNGRVIDSGVSIGRMTVAVLGGPLNTGDTLSDSVTSERIQREGSSSVDAFLASPSAERLYSLSASFSSGIGLETDSLTKNLRRLRTEGNAGMCMLGHSIFTDVPKDIAEDLLEDAELIRSCSSTDMMPHLIRRE